MSSSASDIAISVNGLTKTYRLFNHPADRVKQFFTFGLKKYHREFTALKDVSFEIRKGETVGIIGRNGSGKSTLLQLICGILKPTSGNVKVNGRISALLELGAGFNPEFTGRENIYFQGALMGFTEARMNERFDDIVGFAEIGDFIDQPVRTYSSGMFVRLSFAVAAHLDAEILVIDEALSVGDSYFVQKCMRFIDSFIRKGGNIIFVSHDIATVAQLCRTVYLLSNGHIMRHGAPKHVIEDYIASQYQSNAPTLEVCTTSSKDFSVDVMPSEDLIDARHEFLNSSLYRNTIAVSQFPRDPNGFGDKGATIISVVLLNINGETVTTVLGGELLTLQIQCRANQDISKPLVGFFIKSSIGQPLFGDNTYLTYRDSVPCLKANQDFESKFTFRCPILPLGDYAITVAVADGTETHPVQHHWIHEALLLRSISTSASTGLVGIPMQNITLRAL